MTVFECMQATSIGEALVWEQSSAGHSVGPFINPLDRTPPELAGDIMDRGITLAGGGALLQGMDERMREECEMPAQLTESPLTCVAVGSGRSLEEFEVIHRMSRNSNRRPRAGPRSG
jgi:hypothetical protein